MKVSEVRTQLYLTQEQHDALKRVADQREVSMAQVVREAVAEYVFEAEGPVLDEETYLADPIWQIPDLGESFEGSGHSDLAENHDEYLYGPVKT